MLSLHTFLCKEFCLLTKQTKQRIHCLVTAIVSTCVHCVMTGWFDHWLCYINLMINQSLSFTSAWIPWMEIRRMHKFKNLFHLIRNQRLIGHTWSCSLHHDESVSTWAVCTWSFWTSEQKCNDLIIECVSDLRKHDTSLCIQLQQCTMYYNGK